MLIFILIDVDYLQNVVFNIEKGSNRQNHFSPGSHHQINYPGNPLGRISTPINTILETLPPPLGFKIFKNEKNTTRYYILHPCVPKIMMWCKIA